MAWPSYATLSSGPWCSIEEQSASTRGTLKLSHISSSSEPQIANAAVIYTVVKDGVLEIGVRPSPASISWKSAQNFFAPLRDAAEMSSFRGYSYMP